MPGQANIGGYLLAVAGHLSVPGGREDFSQHWSSCPAAMNVWLSFVIKKFMIRAIPREDREDTLQNEHPKVPVQSWLWQHCARSAFCPRGGFLEPWGNADGSGSGVSVCGCLPASEDGSFFQTRICNLNKRNIFRCFGFKAKLDHKLRLNVYDIVFWGANFSTPPTYVKTATMSCSWAAWNSVNHKIISLQKRIKLTPRAMWRGSPSFRPYIFQCQQSGVNPLQSTSMVRANMVNRFPTANSK